MIKDAVIEYFNNGDRIVKNSKEFFDNFKYSKSTVIKRYEDEESFFDANNISVLNRKKSKFTKYEVDQLIIDYVKLGNSFPKNAKQLTKLGLPSRDVIIKFYDTWKEPFIIYEKMHQKIGK